jgi:hypothetical protein
VHVLRYAPGNGRGSQVVEGGEVVSDGLQWKEDTQDFDRERKPVTTLEELDSLDERDIVSGYHAGRAGAPEPSIEMNRAYWHGWRNGRVDGKYAQPDAAQMTLVGLYIKRGKLG